MAVGRVWMACVCLESDYRRGSVSSGVSSLRRGTGTPLDCLKSSSFINGEETVQFSKLGKTRRSAVGAPLTLTHSPHPLPNDGGHVAPWRA